MSAIVTENNVYLEVVEYLRDYWGGDIFKGFLTWIVADLKQLGDEGGTKRKYLNATKQKITNKKN